MSYENTIDHVCGLCLEGFSVVQSVRSAFTKCVILFSEG